MEDDDVREPGGERPGVEDREERPAARVASRRTGPADTSWAIPTGAMNSVPATIAQVVVTSGEWRRRMRRPEDRVDRPAARPRQGQHVADQRRAESKPLAGGDDQRDARERHERPDELDRVRRVGTDGHRQERGHHRRRGDQQRRIAGRDRLERHRPQDLVAAEPDDAEDEDPERCRRAGAGSRPRASGAGSAA